MSQSLQPSMRIGAGTKFGYRSGPFWKRQTKVLVEAAQEVSVGPGLHLFVAPNGAGKTTLLRALAGLSKAVSGDLSIDGKVHYFSDELRMDPEIKPKSLFRSVLNAKALEQANQFAEQLKLNLSCPIGKLSRGNRQKATLILAETRLQQTGRSVLLMDEPLTGLDAETREQVMDLWAGASAQAVRLIVMHELESVHRADSLFTIRRGELRHTTSPSGASWTETYQNLQK